MKKNIYIYFNESRDEIKNNEFVKDNKVSRIKIIIDYQFKSFEELFEDCKCLDIISFKKFYRNNITNMNGMFYGCSSLKELNVSNFNTNNVTDMGWMFYWCLS